MNNEYSPNIETSELICGGTPNQMSGFYVRGTFVIDGFTSILTTTVKNINKQCLFF